MAEPGDYTPAPEWHGHDFTDARDHYDRNVGRSYSKAVSSSKKLKDLLEKTVKTDSRAPVCIAIDQTGSMGRRTGVFVSKAPYLEHEAKDYLGDDVEFSFAAFGDMPNNESYPLQARPFVKGVNIKKCLDELVIEGKGGGSRHENSEQIALYYLHNAEMPNAENPILIIFTDEMPYMEVDREFALEYAGVKLQRTITTRKLFEELRDKFRVYVIVGPYGSDEPKISNDDMDSDTKEIYGTWLDILDKNHVVYLPDTNRVVDVIFGIFAQEADRVTDFYEEMKGRQTKAQCKVVFESLKTVHAVPSSTSAEKSKHTGKSIMRRPADAGGKKSKDLI